MTINKLATESLGAGVGRGEGGAWEDVQLGDVDDGLVRLVRGLGRARALRAAPN